MGGTPPSVESRRGNSNKDLTQPVADVKRFWAETGRTDSRFDRSGARIIELIRNDEFDNEISFLCFNRMKI